MNASTTTHDRSSHPDSGHCEDRRNALRRRHHRIFWKLGSAAVVAVIAFWLGYGGFGEILDRYAESADPGEREKVAGLERPVERAYLTLQLFTLESNLGSDIRSPVRLVAARLLAALVSGFALFQAAFLLFRKPIAAWRIRRLRGHVVVCGLGEKGFQVVRDQRARGRSVVAIEVDSGNEDIALCEDLGAWSVTGDARDAEALHAAGVERASMLMALTGDDGTNMDIAVNALALAGDRGPNEGFRCCAHVYDNHFASDALKDYAITGAQGRFRAEFPNAFETAARQVLAEHPLERDLWREDDPRRVHLVIAGFGWLGRSIALEAARIAHYANRRKLRLTLVDPDLATLRPAFEQRYPMFAQICDVEWLDAPIEERAVLDAIAREAVPATAGDPTPITTILLCRKGGSTNLAAAMTVHTWLCAQPKNEKRQPLGDVRIGVRVEGNPAIAPLLAQWASQEPGVGRVFVFGDLARAFACDVDRVVDASAVHEAYLQHVPQDVHKTRLKWAELPASLRESNEHHERHIPVKLRAVRCECVPKTADGEKAPAFEFTQDEVERMAWMEHARWNAERWLAGWQLGSPKDPNRRISPYLLPWEDLTEEVKGFDRDLVRDIPNRLKMRGLVLRRIEDGTPSEGDPVTVSNEGSVSTPAT